MSGGPAGEKVVNEDDGRIIFGLDETGDLEWVMRLQGEIRRKGSADRYCIFYSAPLLLRLGSWSWRRIFSLESFTLRMLID